MKHISFFLVLSFLLYFFGQVYLIDDCECHITKHSMVELGTSYAPETQDLKYEAVGCCTADTTEKNYCSSCSISCFINEHVNFKPPILFAVSIFSMDKINKIVTTNNLIFNNFSISDVENISLDFEKENVPTLFGRKLLIQLHSLKIPSHTT